jgi:uncharacterized protein (TIGR03086 family)
MTETTDWKLLSAAHDALRSAVAGVPDDGWALATPCADWNVTQVLQHAAGDQLAYAAKLTGGPGPEANPFEPSGQLDAAPSELLEPALDATAEAFASVAPGTQDVPVPLPPFSMSAELAVGAAALDAAIHAWDIATATSQPSPVEASLAAELRPVAEAIVEPLRGFAFAAAVEPAAGADELTSLVNYLGRV